MDSRLLRAFEAFQAVALAGSFTSAARRLRVAQPALSKTIQNLEAELGVKLFDRLRRGVALTPAGRNLLPTAWQALKQFDGIQSSLPAILGVSTPTLSIAGLPTIFRYFVVPIICRFAEAHPKTEVVYTERPSAALFQMLDSGQLDLGIASLPIPCRFQHEILFKEELLLIAPATHRLALQKNVSMRDLDGEHFIFLEEGHCLADQALTFCRRNGHRNPSVRRVENLDTIHRLVSNGLGISLVPAMAKIGEAGVAYRSLELPRPTRTVAAVWRKRRDVNGSIANCMEIVREVAAAFGGAAA